MNPVVKRWLPFASILALGGLSWWSYVAMYSRPRDELLSEISSLETSIDKLEKRVEEQEDAKSMLKKAAQTTLGSELDVVEHRMRTGLSRVMEQEGLGGIVIDTVDPRAEESPLVRARGTPTAVKKQLSQSPDFRAIRATVKASGPLDRVARAVAVVQSQPWLHRVDGVAIKPIGKERERFELRLDVATLFIPDLVPKDMPEPAIQQADEEKLQYAAAFTSRRLFQREVKAPVVATAVAPPPDAPPPVAPPPGVIFPPYEDWALTGILAGRNGLTVIVVNVKSGESRTLTPGETVLDAKLIEGEGERAVFDFGGKRFEVLNGGTLASRRPLG